MKKIIKKVSTMAGAALIAGTLMSSGIAYAAESTGSWQKTNGSWYYIEPSGTAATGWKEVNGHWYYLESNGIMATGWKYIGNKWYYLEPSGAMATGWKYVNGHWYYLETSGAMATGWKQVNGKWYYLEPSGAMATGWKSVGGKWYYLEPSGAMATGWKSVNGHWYYLEPSDAMATGWKEVDNDWYYLNADGSMHTGYLELDGKMYFMHSSGRMTSGPFDVIYESGTFTVSPKKKQAAEEAARIVLENWNTYGWNGGYEIPKPAVSDLSTLRVGEAIPVLRLMDGKLIYSGDDLYPVICDGKIVTSIRLSTIDASDKAGGPGIPPTESIKEAGYLGGPQVKPYGLENHLGILRQGCALVNNWSYYPGALINSEATELLKSTQSDESGSAFEITKDFLAQIPNTLLVSKPLEI